MKYIVHRIMSTHDEDVHTFLDEFRSIGERFRIPGGEGLFQLKYVYDSTAQNLEKHKYNDKVDHLKRYGLKEPNPMSHYTIEGFSIVLKVF